MKTTVIYHRADFDGIFCREIAKKFLPEAELIGWDYGDPSLEFPKEGTVYVLDLSPECFWESPLRAEWAARLIWIDHHKTAIEKYPSTITGYRIDGVAACRLAWQWFSHEAQGLDPHRNQLDPALPSKGDFVNRTVAEPYAVQLAGEYDIWDKRDPNAELFQLGLKSRKLDEYCWRRLLDDTVEESLQGTGMEQTNSELFSTTLLHSGHVLQFARGEEYREVILEQGYDVVFEGRTYLACNSHELDIRSQLFEAGIKPHHEGLLGFTFTGTDWRVSLYGVPGKDVDHAETAKKYGGGGHKNACGFRVKTLPFLPCSS